MLCKLFFIVSCEYLASSYFSYFNVWVIMIKTKMEMDLEQKFYNKLVVLKSK